MICCPAECPNSFLKKSFKKLSKNLTIEKIRSNSVHKRVHQGQASKTKKLKQIKIVLSVTVIMLLSNLLDNVPNSSKLIDFLSLEKCYQIMCHQLKSPSSRSSNGGKATIVKRHVKQQDRLHHRHPIVVNQLNHNYNRIQHQRNVVNSCSRRHSLKRPPSIDNNMHNACRQQRFESFHIKSNALISVILFFIVLLSNDQMKTVYGEHSRDSFNSIYINNISGNNSGSNNSSVVNNVMDAVTQNTKYDFNTSSSTSSNAAAIDNDIDNLFVIDDVDELNESVFKNVTDNNHPYDKDLYSSSSRRLKRTPIYQNEFAVYVPTGSAMADEIAYKHGFTNMGSVSSNSCFSSFMLKYRFYNLITFSNRNEKKFSAISQFD